MKKIILLTVLGLLISGCASQGYWIVPSGRNFAADDYRCSQDAEFASYRTAFNPGIGGAISDSINRRNWYNRCMRSKGYIWKE